jgi:hypothetical protein
MVIHCPHPKQLTLLTRELYPTREVRPDLLVVVLPDGGDELYAAVKQYVLVTSHMILYLFWVLASEISLVVSRPSA